MFDHLWSIQNIYRHINLDLDISTRSSKQVTITIEGIKTFLPTHQRYIHLAINSLADIFNTTKKRIPYINNTEAPNTTNK